MMRVTIHLCSRADYWPLLEPIRDARRALWLRARKGSRDAEMADGGEHAARRARATAR